MKSGNRKLVYQAIFNWFLNMQSQHVPLSASIVDDDDDDDDYYYYSGEVPDEPVKWSDKNEVASYRDFAEVLLTSRQEEQNPILRWSH